MVSIFESSYFSKTIKKLKQKLFIVYILAEICFIRFRLSLVADPKVGMNLELTTINETSKWSFSCFRVSEHFPSTEILKLYTTVVKIMASLLT